MSNRSCQLLLSITNAGGAKEEYRLRALAPAELPTPFVAGFRLTQIGGPVFQFTADVRLALDGAVNCSCRQWQAREKCDHAEALTAAGILPANLVEVLKRRTQLLDASEEVKQLLTEQLLAAQERADKLLAAAGKLKPSQRS